MAHVYGVKPKAARYREGMPPEERDSFANLLLLCLAHHQEVDSDEHRYPPELLKEWKKQHEGGNNPVLNNLRVTNLDALGELLAELAEPPLQRLEAVTKRLEETGVANAETVRELKQIISTMATMDGDVSAQSARALAYAAEVFSGGRFDESARAAAYAAEVFENSSFDRSAQAVAHAAAILPDVMSRIERAANRMTQFY